MRGFRQFDAPVSIVLTYDKYLEPAAISHFDLGAVAYGICLAACERGLGSVINDQNIMICIAMGYSNDEFSANSVKAVRAN